MVKTTTALSYKFQTFNGHALRKNNSIGPIIHYSYLRDKVSLGIL